MMVDQSLPMAHISPQIFYFRLKGNIQVDQMMFFVIEESGENVGRGISFSLAKCG